MKSCKGGVKMSKKLSKRPLTQVIYIGLGILYQLSCIEKQNQIYRVRNLMFLKKGKGEKNEREIL